MTINRRRFLKASVTSGTAALLTSASARASEKEGVRIPFNLAIKVLATNWGFEGSSEAFCDKVRMAGYDGVEVGLPGEEAQRTELLSAVKKNKLEYAFLVGVWGVSDFAAHLRDFERNLRAAVAARPIYINCHAGRDYYTLEQNKSFIDLTIRLSQESQIPIYNETHRGRILYSAPVSRVFLEQIPDLRLTLDISHWCAVHESLLADQADSINLALTRTDHIHARVGHAEGPQVNDPRAPEWKQALEAHLSWWDKVVENKIRTGAKQLTFLTEFGPLDYMQALPFSRQPVASQWDINVHMLKLLKERYSK